MTTGDPLLDFALSLRSGLLTPIMKGISDANSEFAYLALIPLIYWFVSRRIGFVLLVADAAGTFSAVALKAGLAMPRPPNSGESAWLTSASGQGFPSGHTTAAATTWSSMAAAWKSRGLAGFGFALTAAVGFSRLYLGVHYTRDILGAAAIGLAIGLLVWKGLPSIEKSLGSLPFGRRLILLLPVPALALINSSPEALVILSATGGAAFGQVVADRLGWKLETGGPWRLPLYGAVRLGLGLPVLGLLAVGLGSPSAAPAAEVIVRFVALGVFVTLLGPRVFMAVESRLDRKRAAAPMT